MITQTKRLEDVISKLSTYLTSISEEELRKKPAPGKWSKIEILGHLADSGINNLKRFTEAQFKPEPFEYDNYQQDDLVAANQYQNASLKEVFFLYEAVNRRIIEVMKQQSEKALSKKVNNKS
ncbi:MAG: DinB family protein, partial [Cyclobacteriaceae bacterium]|nr:DinB family protein [Cyclobacteriaceae bacterium SS2]